MADDLERIQRWMHLVITHPGGVAAGIESPDARQHIDIPADDVERVISRSRALESIERLQIYGNAYYARLIECLAAEFPAVQAAVGEDAFSGFVFGHLQKSPSTNYTLTELGRAFPRYLAESRPPRTERGPDWADFLVDLATLERTYSEVFDGPGEERLPLLRASDLLSVPADRWGDVRLRTAPSLRLLELQFPVQEYAAAVRHGQEAVIPPPSKTHLAISRRDYVVRRRSLSPLTYALLASLQHQMTLGAAIEAAVSQTDEDDFRTDLAEKLQEWFRVWTHQGYFVAVETATS